MTDSPDAKPVRGALASQLEILVPDVDQVTSSGTSFLVGLTGRLAGKLFRVFEGEFVLGRASDALVTIEEKAASHRHAKLIMRAGRCVVVDLGSTNGTYVNGVRISSPVELRAGDVVRVGHTNLGYLTEADDEQQHTRALARVSNGLADTGALHHAVALAPSAEAAEPNGLDAALDKLALAARFVRSYWKGMLLGGTLSALVAASTIFVKPPLARAEFLISLRHQGTETPQSRFTAPEAEYFRYPEANFTSPELVRSTMTSLELPTEPGVLVTLMARSLSFQSELPTGGVYRGSLSHADVDLAETFLAAHLQNYLEAEISKALRVLSSEVDLLRKQYEDNEAKLRATEKRLMEFKESHLAGLPEHATSQLEARADLQARSLELRAALDRYTQELGLLRKQQASGDLFVASKVERSQAHSAALTAARHNLAAARGRGLTDSHPEVERLIKEERALAALEQKTIQSDVSDTEVRANRENAALQTRIGQLEVLANSARTELGLVSGRLAEIDKVAAMMPGVEAEFAELSRAVNASQNLHQHLFEQLKAKELKLDFERASVAGRYELLEPLRAEPSNPAQTALKRALMGAALGIALATAASLLHLLVGYARRRQSAPSAAALLPR
jgi:hypothetical protein